MATTLASKRTAYALAAAVLAGCISATVFEAALSHADTYLVFILSVTAIPLFLAGLAAGTMAGIAASVAGFVSLAVREPSNYAVLYAFLYALPTALITAFAVRRTVGADGKPGWLPEGHALMAAALYPCVLFLFMAGIASTHEGGLLALTQDYVAEVTNAVIKSMDSQDAAQAGDLSRIISHYFPAMIGTSWTFLATLSLFVAQKALQQHGWSLRPTFTLRAMRVPDWLILAVAATGLLGVFATPQYAYVGGNLAIMMGVAFFFTGIAVAHAWAATKKLAALILCAFYIAIVFVPFFAFMVALLGVIDQWADFRQRLIKQTRPT